jgi:hypothetical protein
MSAKIQNEKRIETNLLKCLNDGNISSTYPFIFRTMLLQFICDVHNREGDDKMTWKTKR